MSKTIRAVALALLLAPSAQAGWIQNGVAGPPPPSAGAEREAAAGSVMPDGGAGLTGAVLNLLGSVLALF